MHSEESLLSPLIRQLEKSGDVQNLALARVLEVSHQTAVTLEKVNYRLEKVEEQVLKTNGRVTQLEANHEIHKDKLRIQEIKTSDEYKAVHCPFMQNQQKLEEKIEAIESTITLAQRYIISIGVIFGASFAVFGYAMWQKFMFLSNLDEAAIVEIVKETLSNLHIP